MNFSPSGFERVSKIHESVGSVVYRAHDTPHARDVVLKVLREEPPTAESFVRYQQEFEITAGLDFPDAIKAFELRPHAGSAFIVLEDFGGEALRDVLARRRLSIEEVLELAIKTARQLGQIHARGIIHRDVCPANIVWNERTGELKIIDFGISSSFGKECPRFAGTRAIVGTLAYLAPEQSGRTNRVVDYRADYYALGATLYELASGHPPFIGEDALDLVHCHLARTPRPLHESDPSIPEMFSRITAKLLMKSAEERYQSVAGLLHDLELCLEAVREGEPNREFRLGERDVPETLQLSQNVYGRQSAIQALLGTFDRVAHGARELVLVTGQPGIGKTTVVHELQRPVTRQRGFFLTGKYDQLQRDVPSSALIAAFRALVQQMLGEEEAALAVWRERLTSAVGAHGAAIVGLIPDLEKVIGPQPPLSDLGSVEAQARFFHVFRKFVGALCSATHPLVIFLDDLQWADASSLRLIELLLTDEQLSHFLLIGAYRDNEVSAVHPTLLTVTALERQEVPITRVTLAPLQEEDIAQLLADSLRLTPRDVSPLAALVMRKTGGNPFFALQFCKRLAEKLLLRFDPACRRWVWDEAAIEAQSFTENVVALVVRRLRELSTETQRALAIGALLGNEFRLGTLSLALEQGEGATFAALRSAIVEGIIVTGSPLRSTSSTDLSAPLVADELRFTHDRLQQAAAALIPAAELASTHLCIGRLLRAGLSTSSADRPRTIFDVVGHLNAARALLVDEDERTGLARLNVEAGEKALAAQAPEAAARHLALALEEEHLLWREDAMLAFRATLERARAEALSGRPEAGEAIALRLLRDADERLGADRLRKADVYAVIIRLRTIAARYSDARAAATEILSAFGLQLPMRDEGAAVAPLVARIERLLAGRPLSSLADLPETEDTETRAMMELLNEVSPPAFFLDANLFAVIGLELAALALERGLTRHSAIGFAMYSLVLRMMGKLREAAQVGRAAMEISDRFNDPSQQAQTYNIYGAHTGGWVEHVRNLTPILERGCQLGLIGGVPQFSGFTINNRLMNELFGGQPLGALLEKTQPSLAFCARQANLISLHVVEAVTLAATNLAGKTRDPLAFHLGDREQEAFLQTWEEHRSHYATCSFLIDRAMVHLLYGSAASAFDDLARAEPLLAFLPGNLALAKHAFWFAIAHVLTDSTVPVEARAARRTKLEALGAQLREWAEVCPANFRHMTRLVDAELARLQGDWVSALSLYDEAVADAAAQGFVHHEAFGEERLAELWLWRGRPEYAAPHVVRARQGFERWGAAFKVADLVARYSDLLRRTEPRPSAMLSTNDSVALSAQSLDVMSVVKATQAISGSIVFEQLLATLMRVVLQNAGAERGALFVVEDGELFVEADGAADRDEITVNQHVALASWAGGPRSVVQYVARTLEPVVIGDAATDSRFAHDPYLETSAKRAVLCLPIVKQGAPTSILLLANDVANNVFSTERIALLKILAGQVAVSLENARLLLREKRARAEAERAVKARDEFLIVASHELRTPMTSLSITVQTLLRNAARLGVPPALITSLERADRQSQRLARLVGELLDVTRLQAGVLDLQMQEVDMRALLDDVVKRLEPEFARAGSRLSIEGPSSVPGRCDPSRVEQVVTNLLANALKFGQGRPVEVRLEDDPSRTQIEVRDHGIGIAPDVLPRIFDRFARGVSERHYGGLGLGLFITRGIVEAHDGAIHVASELGNGTRFVVELPHRRAEVRLAANASR